MRLRKKLSTFWARWERPFNLAALGLGFFFDIILASDPSSFANNALLISYLCMSAIIIIAINTRSVRMRPSEPRLLLFILQFCFGGLASNMLVVYGNSGTIGASVLFLVILGAFLLGNEFLRTRYNQLRFNIAIYYFLLLTYCIIALPTLVVHRLGALVFLGSGLLSLCIIACIIWALHVFVFKKKEWHSVYEVSVLVGIIFVALNGLYFLNLIPPVPLSLKSVGVYHSLSALPEATTDGTLYSATYEKPAWYTPWRSTNAIYTTLQGQAYCFSAVFAPGKLATPIVHRWEKLDVSSDTWITQSTVSFPISGGREGGYRGWSSSTVSPGTWRCGVETGRGALIGRTTFDVVSGTPSLSTTQL